MTALVEWEPNLRSRSLFEELLVSATLTAPSFTVRGGTTEVLRSVVAKGLRSSNPVSDDSSTALLSRTISQLLSNTSTAAAVEAAEADRWSPAVWDPMAEAGFPWVGVPEEAGGSGGTLSDAAALLRAVGAAAAPVPLAETGMLGGWLLSEGGLEVGDGPLTVISDPRGLTIEHGRIQGRGPAAWAGGASRIVALVATGDSWVVASIRPEQVRIEPGANLAGEPCDTVIFDVALDEIDHGAAPAGVDGAALLARGALSRTLLAAGAAAAMSRLTLDYTWSRQQFGNRWPPSRLSRSTS